MKLEPPPSFHITTEWRVMPDSVKNWIRVLWIELAAKPSGQRIPLTVDNSTATAWKAFSRGKNARAIFIHLKSEAAHILVNWTTKQIRLS